MSQEKQAADIANAEIPTTETLWMILLDQQHRMERLELTLQRAGLQPSADDEHLIVDLPGKTDRISRGGMLKVAAAGAAGLAGAALLKPQDVAAAGSSADYYLDSLSVPYVCEVGGLVGTWQSVGNFRPFPAGHRVFNSSMAPSGLATGISALTDVHAMSTGVPATAIAVYCAVQSYESGTLTIFPDGATEPTAANWSGVGTTGILNLLYMVVPLSAAGKFSVRSHLTASGKVYVDVWGYLM